MVLGVVTHGSILSLLLLSVFSLFHMSESETRGNVDVLLLLFFSVCAGHVLLEWKTYAKCLEA